MLRQKSTLTPEAFLYRKNTFEKKDIEFNKDTQTKRKNITVARKKAIDFANSLKKNLEKDSIINKNEKSILINKFGGGEKKSIAELLSNNPLSEHITKSRILQGPYSKVEKIIELNN